MMRSSTRPELSPIQSGRLAIFERYSSEFATYAFAISHFSQFESALLGIFIYLDDRPQRESIDAYWNISSCRARFEWVESRIQKLPKTHDLFMSWASIRDRLSDAINVRNELAHGQFESIMISHTEEIVGFWARLVKSASIGQLSLNAETRLIEGAPFFSPDQLIDQGLEFISLAESMFAMVPRINTPEGSKPARLVDQSGPNPMA